MKLIEGFAKRGTAVACGLLLAGLVAAPGAGAATTTEEVSHYSATPTVSTSTTMTSSTKEVEPKEEKAKPKPKPKHEVKPKHETGPPVSTTTTATSTKAALPFTGFNLTWVLVGGVALLAAGISLRLIARRSS